MGDAAAPARRLPDQSGHHAVLYPAIAEVAHRAGADAVGLIDVGRPAGLNLAVDRAGITYLSGQFLGDPGSAVQVECSLVGAGRVPERAMPEVVARVILDRHPLDISQPDNATRLRAALPPDDPERLERLDAELAVAASDPARLVVGDAVGKLGEAIALVPPDAVPVVMTTWVLSRLKVERRTRFLHELGRVARERPVAWVSVEGVGVAPGVSTLGDRPASGHSMVGLAALDGTVCEVETVGRCWMRGRMMAWLVGGADS